MCHEVIAAVMLAIWAHGPNAVLDQREDIACRVLTECTPDDVFTEETCALAKEIGGSVDVGSDFL